MLQYVLLLTMQKERVWHKQCNAVLIHLYSITVNEY